MSVIIESRKQTDFYRVIDGHGDLLFRVGTSPHHLNFRVSSAVIRLASPVWQNLRKEKKVPDDARDHFSSSDQMIECPNADPDAIFILLVLAHMRFRLIPETIPLPQLASLAKACELYEMIDLAYPHVDAWMVPHVEKGFDPAVISDRAWIGWIFDREHDFRRVTKYVMTNMTESEVKCLDDLPPGCNDFFSSHMKHRMRQITNKIYDLSTKIKDNGATCNHLDASEEDRRNCEFQRFAALLMFLKTFDLPTVKDRYHQATGATANLNVVHAAAELVEERGSRNVSGAKHMICIAEISEVVRKLEKMIDSIEDIDEALESLYSRSPLP